MSLQLCPTPLLQSPRTVITSNDDGTTTPLPIPYQDFWDINSVPNAGLTQVYRIVNMAEYQGRVIYINKTQDTTGGTIRLSLPGGYTFSSTGSQDYDFTDAPSCIILTISTSPIVSIQAGDPSANPTLINYQVPDLNLGTGNVITQLQDTTGNTYIDVATGGDITLSTAGDIIPSCNGTLRIVASNGYAITIPPTKTMALTSTGSLTVANATTFTHASVNCTALANSSTANLVYYNSANGRLSYAAAPLARTFGFLIYSATTSQSLTSATPTLLAVTTSFDPNSTGDLTEAADNRLQYNGATTKTFKVTFTGNATLGTPAQNGIFTIARSGTNNPDSVNTAYFPDANNLGVFTCSIITTLATGQYVELFGARSAADTRITIVKGTLMVESL